MRCKVLITLCISMLFFLSSNAAIYAASAECEDCHGAGFTLDKTVNECPICHGDVGERVQCEDCSGAGIWTTTTVAKCSECGGHGTLGTATSVNCSICSGTGKITSVEYSDCDHCSGKGYTTTDKSTTCSNCSGKGYTEYIYTCSTCKGAGTVTNLTEVSCSTCKGKGTTSSACTFAYCDSGYINWCYNCGQDLSVDFEDYKCPYCASEYLSERKCNRCNGTGKVTSDCLDCSGTGTVVEDSVITCAACKGAGNTGTTKLDCEVCDGEGSYVITERITCTYCDSGSVGTSVKSDCTQCNGTGKVLSDVETCAYCSNGYIKTVIVHQCATCNGIGYTGGNACLACEGSGQFIVSSRINCTTCGGTGLINTAQDDDTSGTIVDKILKGIAKLFIPTSAPVKDMFDLLDKKLPIATQLYSILFSYVKIFENYDYTDYRPTIVMHMGGWYGVGDVEVINFDWYRPYRDYVNIFLSGVLWLAFGVSLFKKIPSLIKGV